MRQQYNLRIPRDVITSFEQLKQQTGITVSELMRMMFCHCMTPPVLNEIVPCMSGSLSVSK